MSITTYCVWIIHPGTRWETQCTKKATYGTERDGVTRPVCGLHAVVAKRRGLIIKEAYPSQ